MEKLKIVLLEVPYVSQAPGGVWEAPWDESCEEASAIMVDAFYADEKNLTGDGVANKILEIIGWENKALGKNKDTSALEMKEFIDNTLSFNTGIQRNPKLEDIKKQLRKDRPVIALINMYQLYGEKAEGDSYHVAVIIGYDDIKQEFVLHDPARPERKNYSYDAVMRSLHDFNPNSREADGEPTVLFTSS